MILDTDTYTDIDVDIAIATNIYFILILVKCCCAGETITEVKAGHYHPPYLHSGAAPLASPSRTFRYFCDIYKMYAPPPKSLFRRLEHAVFLPFGGFFLRVRRGEKTWIPSEASRTRHKKIEEAGEEILEGSCNTAENDEDEELQEDKTMKERRNDMKEGER